MSPVHTTSEPVAGRSTHCGWPQTAWFEAVDLCCTKLMVVDTEVGILVMPWPYRHLPICTFQVVGLCNQATILAHGAARTEVLLDNCAKGVDHVKIELVVNLAAVIDS